MNHNDEIKDLEKAAAQAEREAKELLLALARRRAQDAERREAEAKAKRMRKAGITAERPQVYKGEQLEQLTDGNAAYVAYRRRAVVPYFVFRTRDGELITSCAFRVAALAVTRELNRLAAQARALYEAAD